MKNRNLFDGASMDAIKEVFDFYGESDFGYQGEFEKRYTEAFVAYQGGDGYADAVCSGTAALYIAIASLQLPENSHILVSPITDPGTISAIILNRLTPVIIDSMPNSYNVGLAQFLDRLTDKTKAVVVVHAGGKAAQIKEIADEARGRGIFIIEDCSQAHGAGCNNQKVGTFGDIAAFSTMYRKNHATGGCGGVVYTKNEQLYRLARAYADRGKPFFEPDFNEKNPSTFLFPALNLNQDEISCALGSYTLAKLDGIRQKRIYLLRLLDSMLKKEKSLCTLMPVSDDDSPFFWPIFFEKTNKVDVKSFAQRVLERGAALNPRYNYVVSDWNWFNTYAFDNFTPYNAKRCVENSFNLLFHEGFERQDIERLVDNIIAIEREIV